MDIHTVHQQHSKTNRVLRLLAISATVLGLLLVVGSVLAAVTFQDINPNASDNGDANASTGGRVNGLAADPTNSQIYYAASEFGGLFKTTDGGSNRSRLD